MSLWNIRRLGDIAIEAQIFECGDGGPGVLGLAVDFILGGHCCGMKEGLKFLLYGVEMKLKY
jgi:hypothetical protein